MHWWRIVFHDRQSYRTLPPRASPNPRSAIYSAAQNAQPRPPKAASMRTEAAASGGSFGLNMDPMRLARHSQLRPIQRRP